MSGTKASILVVDDNGDLADVLCRSIDGEPDMRCIGTLASADTLLDAVVARKPDIVLLDLTMPGRDPLEAMTEAAMREPITRFIVLSGYDDAATIEHARRSGASGFVSKHGGAREILDAIRALMINQ